MALAAVLPVAACGGSATSPASSGTFRPAAGSAAPSPATTVPSPGAALPPDARIVFETPLPSDPVEARIIADFQQAWRAYYLAVVTQGNDQGFFDRVTGQAFETFDKNLRDQIAQHLGVTGTMRFFDTRVAARQGRGAAVLSCVDVSRWYEKDLRSGRRFAGDRPASWAHFAALGGMRRGDDGVWRLNTYQTYVLPDPAAKECQP